MRYTVVLLRPEYMCNSTNEKYGQNIYVAHVYAANEQQAVDEARIQTFNADKAYRAGCENKDDYKLCILFEGYQIPRLFGWQVT